MADLTWTEPREVMISVGKKDDEEVIHHYEVVNTSRNLDNLLYCVHEDPDKTPGEFAIKCFTKSDGLWVKEVTLAETLKRENHENIVRFIDCFEGTPRNTTYVYLVMESLHPGALMWMEEKDHETRSDGINKFFPYFCEKRNVTKANSKFSRGLALMVIKSLLSALECLHDKLAHAHLDIKPANILVQTLDGTNKVKVKLADFGSAKPISNHHMVSVGNNEGTAGFTPLENRWRNPGSPPNHINGVKSDIWSLGVTYYTMLRGRNPFVYICSESYLEYLSMSNGTFSCDKLKTKKRASLVITRTEYWSEAEIIGAMCHPAPFRRPTPRQLLDMPIFQETDDNNWASTL